MQQPKGLTRPGDLSERTRQKHHALKQEWNRLHPQQEPAPYRTLPRWSAVLALPWALGLVGGCAGAGVVPLLGVLLACLPVLVVAAFGEAKLVDVLTGRTAPYWVVHQRTAYWQLSESSYTVWTRRKRGDGVAPATSYPDDFPGRIVSVIDGRKPRPGWASGELHAALLMDLTPTQYSEASARRVKLVGTTLVPIALADRFGAATATLTAKYSEAELVAAKEETPEPDDAVAFETHKAISDAISAAVKALPATDAHTGTGLYAVKATPTQHNDTLSGDAVGQVISLDVGGLGVAAAWAGGYVVNTTRSETRSIVSHIDNEITLEGSLTNWVYEDVVEVYDAWDTVQGGTDRLSTDQGVTLFASQQELRLYTGTYTEVVVQPAFIPSAAKCMLISVSGAVVLANATAASTLTLAARYTIVRGLKIVHTNGGVYSAVMLTNRSMRFEQVELDGQSTGLRAFRVTTAGVHSHYLLDCYMHNFTDAFPITLLNCYVKRTTFESAAVSCTYSGGVFVACVFDGCGLVTGSDGYGFYANDILYHCTFYGAASAISMGGSPYAYQRLYVRNCIFKDCTTVFTCVDGLQVLDCDYNVYEGYTTFCNNYGGTARTLTQWQTIVDEEGNSPDAHSFVADPLLIDPAAGDFSLQVNSPCRHRGAGAGVVEGVNGVAFDPYHPDIGAWSSGLVPGRAVGSAG